MQHAGAELFTGAIELTYLSTQAKELKSEHVSEVRIALASDLESIVGQMGQAQRASTDMARPDGLKKHGSRMARPVTVRASAGPVLGPVLCLGRNGGTRH